MGIQERRVKEKAALKAKILKGARMLFIEKGIEATTIRNIADAIEYSIGTVYVYYQDKNAILHDLHKQGFSQLGGEMMLHFHIDDAMERLIAIGKVYIEFAIKNPDMYDLMFTMKAPMEYMKAHHEEEWNEGKATFAVLKSTVAACIEQGYFKNHAIDPVTFTIWSAVHGMCSLHINERVKGVNLAHPEQILQEAYEAFVMLIRSSK